ncbi:hypothetical protein N8D56_11355 [Devosia sp. A8/3-2]|nr:hypothetical protein N8D56_11355 [Devosia sp. A8/3-2]
MKYLLMLYADEKAGAAIPPEQMAGFMGKLQAYQESLEKAGAFVATAGLSPTTGRQDHQARYGRTQGA